MALYQNGNELTHMVDARFNQTHKPGAVGPYSGIYICINCRDEAACNAGNPLPPQNHRQHSTSKGDILWKLLVQTQTGPQA